MAEPENTPDLYDTDILIWSEEQAEFLRRRAANALDWDNLAEEIADVGLSQLHAVMSHRHRSLIAGWAVKPSVHRLSGDECPCRVMVLSAVGVSRRMMVSEAPAS